MSYPFGAPVIRLPFTILGAAAYPRDPAEFRQLFPLPYEAEAAGHWLLGTDNPDRLDMVSRQPLARTLTPTLTAGGSGYPANAQLPLIFSGGSPKANAPAATGLAVTNSSGVVTTVRITNHGNYAGTPTVAVSTAGGGSGATVTIASGALGTDSAGYLTTATGGRVGLSTPFPESTDITLMMVLRKQSSGQIILDTRPSSGASGAAVYITSSGLFFADTTGIGSQQVDPPTSSDGDWLFLGLSISPIGRTVIWGNGGVYTLLGGPPVPATPPYCWGLGNTIFGTSGTLTAGVGCAELIVVPRSMTASEMQAVYARSKVRVAARGISVL